MAFLDPNKEIVRTRGRKLPHWFQEGCTVYETIRLCDSLPAAILRPWEARRGLWLRAYGVDVERADWRDRFAELPGDVRLAFHAEWSEGMEALLDAGHGACVLDEPGVRPIVEAALRHWDGVRWRLGDFVVAGNHAYALMTPLEGFEITEEMGHLKRLDDAGDPPPPRDERADLAARGIRPAGAEPRPARIHPGLHRLTLPGAAGALSAAG